MSGSPSVDPGGGRRGQARENFMAGREVVGHHGDLTATGAAVMRAAEAYPATVNDSRNLI